MLASLTIARRFRGPLNSANGGYAAGLLAQAVGEGGVEVTLRLPPPLDRPLQVTRDGERVLLQRRGCARRRGPPRRARGSPRQRRRASPRRTRRPARSAAGARRSSTSASSVAGVMTARASTSMPDGCRAATTSSSRRPGSRARSVPEIVWAAIDCPGAYALRGEGRGEPLLARMTARVDRLPDDGERCVVVGWPLDADGRKRNAGTALYGADGAPIAVSRQLWIEPRGHRRPAKPRSSRACAPSGRRAARRPRRRRGRDPR